MKKNKVLLFVIALGGIIFFSCEKEDKLDSNSVFVESTIPKNPLDNYVFNELTKPYNISILYKYVDKESDLNYNLVPAPYDASIRLTKLLIYLGIEPYNDITGSKEFIKNNYPKLFTYTGSVPVRNNGTIVLGTAEAGTKVSLYNLINLDTTNAENVIFLNQYFFKTIQHEFQHILNQNKPYTSTFAEISGTDYVGNSWNTEFRNIGEAIAGGFISPYASNSDKEDFAEIFSFYITRSQVDWDAILNTTGGTEIGKITINTKLDIVKSYMKSEWGIDMDILRSNILNRYANLSSFDSFTLN